MLKVNALAKALFITESPRGLCLVLFFFCLFINDLPLHITSNIVSCEMFADDTTLAESDTDPVSVKKKKKKKKKYKRGI